MQRPEVGGEAAGGGPGRSNFSRHTAQSVEVFCQGDWSGEEDGEKG